MSVLAPIGCTFGLIFLILLRKTYFFPSKSSDQTDREGVLFIEGGIAWKMREGEDGL